MEPAIKKTKKSFGYSSVESTTTDNGISWIDGYYHGKLGIVRIYSYMRVCDKKIRDHSSVSTIINGYEYTRNYERAFTQRGLEMKAAQLLKEIYKK